MISEKEFNENNRDVLRTLDLGYFSDILKENEKLVKENKKIERNLNKILKKLRISKICSSCGDKGTKIVEHAEFGDEFATYCDQCFKTCKKELGYASTYDLIEDQDFITFE